MNPMDEIVFNLRDYARTHTAAVAIFAILLVAGIVVLAFGRRLRVVFAKRRELQRLFLDLARAHRLDDAEQDLLLDMTSFYRLGNPAVIFVSPSLVRGYARRAEIRDRYQDPSLLDAQVAAVAEKLFA